jgi:hypothetical protein
VEDERDWRLEEAMCLFRASERRSSFVIFWSMNSEREGPGGRRGLMLLELLDSERRNN